MGSAVGWEVEGWEAETEAETEVETEAGTSHSWRSWRSSRSSRSSPPPRHRVPRHTTTNNSNVTAVVLVVTPFPVPKTYLWIPSQAENNIQNRSSHPPPGRESAVAAAHD